MLGKDDIQSQPEALAIAVVKYRQNKGAPEAQAEKPIPSQPVKQPSNQQGNDPQPANQALANGDSIDKKTVPPAISEIAFRAFLKSVKEVFQNRSVPASRALIEKSPLQINNPYRTNSPAPKLESRAGGFGMIGYPKFTERG